MRIAWAFLLWTSLPAQTVDFAREVHPILVARCFACHDGPKAQAGLSLTTREGMLARNVVVPGNSAASLLILRVTGARQPVMPMGGERLKPSETDLLRRWIDQGANVNIEPPRAAGYSLTLRPPQQTSLDAVLLPYFEQHKVKPAAPVSDAVFLRRVYLDLWGLLPPPERQAQFLTDTRPDKRARVVEELLAHPRNYAEHWITFWNDLLHNDEGVVYHGDRESITPWLLKALETNKPYNDFVAALLAPFGKDDPSGFVQGVTWRGTVNASQTPAMQAAQNSAQVFLGINLKCNSCHDSFISHWKLKEAYALASFFTSEPLEIVRCDKATGQMAEPKFLFPQLGSIDKEEDLEEKRAAAARYFTARDNGLFARTIVNRIWRLMFGRGLVEPLDEMESPAWSPEVLDFLAADLIAHRYDLRHLLKTICESRAYQFPTVASASLRDRNYVFTGPWPRRLTAEEFADAVASLTGEWRIRVDNRPVAGLYAREWRFKASSLDRALGRPIRDGAVTERLTESTTLQALELTNGRSLNDWLADGSKRMLGNPDPAPASLFDSGLMRGAARVNVDIDVAGRKEVRLLIVDVDSYDPARVQAGWKIDGLPESFPVAFGNEIVVDLDGKDLTRLRGTVFIDPASKDSDIGPAIRAFVFDRPPNRSKLVTAQGEPPVQPLVAPKSPAPFVDQVYQYALSRRPAPAELKTALALAAPSGRLEREGVQDLLWTLLLSPEFQFIR